ncbi:hypothetical protein CEUSTIGMA_g2525.t1 [Chlamydomonas eustigma]|uniref:Uncharacterized protein n=1 Tax=Chlamydomonas eustigma TaxID=1157962 RepID=A0A250WW89_9CHLO|nr:hypothetical protein CEUSTIGMA_g2525.t1 [Chlamydomonas eustigma]|eukprot:GAX75081.1 hypothetical protein CEUSTIGMA_g2525.t1 [Chlamydomonas eustigma]
MCSINICRRLAQRELHSAKPGTGVHVVRGFCGVLCPTTQVLDVDNPAVHICRFTPDGQYLVCFASAGQELVLYRVKGLSLCVPQPSIVTQAQLKELIREKLSNFDSIFALVYRRLVVLDSREQLCKDFCVTVCNGKFLLLGSQTPQAQQQQQQQQAADASPSVPEGLSGVPCITSITLHLVDIHSGDHLDSITFHNDFIQLHLNGGISLHDSLLNVLTIRSQTIHLFQIHPSGRLLPVHKIGQYCRADDELVIRTAEAAESRWQAGKGAAALPGRLEGASWMPTGVMTQRGSQGRVPAGRTTAVSHGQPRYQQGQVATGRPPLERQLPEFSETVQHNAFEAVALSTQEARISTDGPSTIAALTANIYPPQQLPRRRLTANRSFPARPSPLAPPLAASGSGGAGSPIGSVTKECKTFIVGIKQRLIAHLFQTRLLKAGSSPKQQQTELRWLYRKFDLYCSLVIWRVQLLSSSHILLDLGLIEVPPDTSGVGVEAGQLNQPNPQRSLYFMVYDMQATKVIAFFESSNPLLVPLLLRHAVEMQSDAEMAPWERMAFTHMHAAMLSESMGFVPVHQASKNGLSTVENSSLQVHTSAASFNQEAVMGPSTVLRVDEGGEVGASRTLPTASEQTGLRAELNNGRSPQAAQRQQQDNLAVLRHLLAALPGTPQALSSSPLLDPCLFDYDKKLVGPLIRSRKTSERFIKFFSRHQEDRAAFRIQLVPERNSNEQGAASMGAQTQRAALHLFHPVLPLALSIFPATAGEQSRLNIHLWAMV